MKIEVVTHNSMMLYFEQRIDDRILNQVQQTFYMLKELEGVIDLTPSYASILVEFDHTIHTHEYMKNIIHKQIKTLNPSTITTQRHIKIPTKYHHKYDLEHVAKYNNLSINEVIKLHSSTIYRVYAIGFMVGFAYLASIPQKIATPRLSTPRSKVPKGSVAIADAQTAIYPQQSAGGWNIIGETDFEEYNSFNIGDSVQFVRI